MSAPRHGGSLCAFVVFASVALAAIGCTDDAMVLRSIVDAVSSGGTTGMGGTTAGNGGAPDASAGGLTGSGGIPDASAGGQSGSGGSASDGASGSVSTDGSLEAAMSVDGGVSSSDAADASAGVCSVGSTSGAVCLARSKNTFDDGQAARCEVRADHTLWCWGEDAARWVSWQEPRFPLQVGSDADWTSVSVGRDSICGLRGTGSLWCFGQFYRPGAPGSLLEQAPVQIGTAEDWAEVSVGAKRYLAVKKDGTLWRWGSWFDVTDAGLILVPLLEPAQVGTDTDWATATIGTNVGCAIKGTGALYCLGFNNAGVLGDGTTATRPEPTPVSGGGAWAGVAVGVVSCGIRTDGTLWCWGPKLGNVPVQSGTDSDWVEVSGHDFEVVGRRASGNIYSIQNVIDGLTQVEPIDETGGYTAIASHCARREDGTHWCWDYLTPRGDGSGNVEMSPLRVGTASDWVSIDLHWQEALGLHTNGRVDAVRALPSIAALSPVRDVYGNGENNQCAIRSDGTLWCAGSGYGPGGAYTETAVQQGSANDWLRIVMTDQSFGCAIRGASTAVAQQGTLWCTASSYNPVWAQVGTDGDWMALSAGDRMCGIRADGSLWCWSMTPVPGGGGTVSQFEQVGADLDWTSIAVGSYFTCGIRAGGQLWCSGDNDFGQLGIGTRVDAAALVQVLPGTKWSAIAAGATWACGIQIDGSLWCWGDDTYGQLGLGSPGATRLVPERVGSFSDWQFVDASSSQEAVTCAIRQGELYCWGENASGMVTRTYRAIHAPVQVMSGPAGGYPFCPYREDLDHDGYAGCYGDCDDGNANVSPFVPEICNGIDDNCNQQIDEGCP